ncbi:hypothetical protein FDI69_gp174 [Rhodococcus phage Trina]|uniref:Uncharacterized protein n=1 Tax=Rhodococcus phage Trina TaxID=2027905 RepID=A0A2D1A2H8_9CAUD|nr:hypothetical protein FDI69_gp174 [Rhodococcus phage Trina]ASZ75012.1 hypothetical protein SEA_TRINA_233 [Rhodococcus phage Trina]
MAKMLGDSSYIPKKRATIEKRQARRRETRRWKKDQVN